MQQNAQIIIVIGGLFLLGMAAHFIGKRTFLPRVSLLIVFGILIGPAGLDWIPVTLVNSFELIATMALLMIGFLLGGKLTRDTLTRSGKDALCISLIAAIGTTGIVFAALVIAGVSVELALLLGCIASATAPAATVDIVTESGYRTRFSEMLLLVVALDDIWGLVLFSLALAGVSMLQGLDGNLSAILGAAREVGGGAAIGLLIGLPAAYLTGRIRPGQPILTEALGLTFLCGGLALWTETSFLIAAIIMGATIANLAQHHDYPFHAIEDVELPFLSIFFILAGASLELNALWTSGLLGLTFMVSRSCGKLAGGWLGSTIARSGAGTASWMGLALMPQAGVAVGMALVASSAFPEYGSILMPIVIAATVIFEIVGPVGTRSALAATRNYS